MSWKIYLLAFVTFLIGTSELVIAGILDLVAEDLGVSVSAAGQLVSVFALTVAVGSPILILLTGKVERKRLLAYSLIGFIAGNAIAYFSGSYGFLMVSRVVLALSTGVFAVGSLAFAARLAPEGKQGSAIATVITGLSVSMVLGVPLGRVMAAFMSWNAIFAVIGLISIPALAAIYRYIPSMQGQASASMKHQLALLKDRRVSSTLLTTLFWIAGYEIVFAYISPYLLHVVHFTSGQLSIGLFAFGLFSILGSRLGGMGSDRWGVARTQLSGLALHAAMLLLLLIAGQSMIATFPILVAWSLSAWTTVSAQMVRLIQLSPQSSEVMISMNNTVLQLGIAAGAAIGGIVVNGSSVSHIGWVGAISVMVALGLAAYSHLAGRGKAPKAGGDVPSDAKDEDYSIVRLSSV
ncbi:MFS transporter [Cohnella suwonensis]|uniref:MFS transporter n=1 Tax=Cohnella suwonensis TaxID=696072 RepID=A0ABW0LWM7_9BACL